MEVILSNMDKLSIISDLILCLGIIAGAITFTIANVNYLPKEDESLKKEKE